MHKAVVYGNSFIFRWGCYVVRKTCNVKGKLVKTPAQMLKLKNADVVIRGYPGLKTQHLDDPNHKFTVRLEQHLRAGDARLLIVDCLVNDLDGPTTELQLIALFKKLAREWLLKGAYVIILFLPPSISDDYQPRHVSNSTLKSKLFCLKSALIQEKERGRLPGVFLREYQCLQQGDESRYSNDGLHISGKAANTYHNLYTLEMKGALSMGLDLLSAAQDPPQDARHRHLRKRAAKRAQHRRNQKLKKCMPRDMVPLPPELRKQKALDRKARFFKRMQAWKAKRAAKLVKQQPAAALGSNPLDGEHDDSLSDDYTGPQIE